MLLPECTGPIIVSLEKSSKAETQDGDFRLAMMKVVKNLKEDMNQSLNEVCENTKEQSKTLK